jgi:tRNA (guanine-N7-)-methyltransferase
VAKKKLIHFAENLHFRHLFQQSYTELMEGFPMKGRWRSGFFRNSNPVVLELGCGKGEYTVNLALANPGKNFIGIDIKGARLWKGCKLVEENQIANAAFIRSRVELLDHFFSPGEVDEIWLTFPDPHDPHRRSRKRLTSTNFLEKYRKVLAPDGLIHLKTDSLSLFQYTLEVIRDQGHILVQASEDIYKDGGGIESTSIQTFYEGKFREQGIPIKYIEFRLRHEE